MRTGLWIRAAALLLVLMMFAGCSTVTPPATTEPSQPAQQETTQPTEATKETEEQTEPTEPPAEPDGKLYYNVDKGAARQEGMLGMYMADITVDGTTKNVWFKNKTVMDKADTMTVFSAATDNIGAVVEVFPVEELGLTVKENLTILSVAADKITAADAAGAEVTLTPASGMVSAVVDGSKDSPREKDVVTVVENADKQVTAMFITKRPPIMAMCPHCQTEVEWTLWTNTSAVPISESGHFRLSDDVTLKSQLDINEEVDIVLDLNGYTITGNGLRCIVLNNASGQLSVMDSSEAQSGKITADSQEVNRGVCLWARSGAINLYSGTLDTSHIASTANGLAVDVVGEGIFNMYGGTIIGGHCTSTSSGCGSIRVRGEFNMYGGTIKNGKSDFGGGNVRIEATGSFKMSGGTITGGTGNAASAPVTGTVEANVTLAEGAVFEKTGGTIEGE